MERKFVVLRSIDVIGEREGNLVRVIWVWVFIKVKYVFFRFGQRMKLVIIVVKNILRQMYGIYYSQGMYLYEMIRYENRLSRICSLLIYIDQF